MRHPALEMILEGHPVEIVMNILGLEPEEMLDIINGVLGEKIHVIEFITQIIDSKIIEKFEVNLN